MKPLLNRMIKRIWILLFFFIIFSESSSQVNLFNGLVAHYPFNGNANDVSGNNFNGTPTNGPILTTDRFGNANSAYYFDGLDDYIKISDNGAFSTPQISIVLWFQTESSAMQCLVGKRDFSTTAGTGGAQYQMPINYSLYPGIVSNLVGNINTCNSITVSSYINSNQTLCNTKWYCVVVTFDGTFHKIFIDGVLKVSQQTSFNGFLSCTSELRLGNWWQLDLQSFKGKIDDFRWYNRPLNQDEVTALYNGYSSSSSVDFSYSQNVCNPKSVQFFNLTPNATSYTWDLGNSTTSTSSNPSVNYASYGIYNVKLKVQTSYGCVDSTTKSIPIDLQQDNSLISNNSISVCSGNNVTINISDTGVNHCWSPTTGISNINSATSTITPATSATYYFTAQTQGANLVTNGDFSAGNTSFQSSYQLASTNTGANQYWVGNNNPVWLIGSSACLDHTTSGGNMMMVNGGSTVGAKVWEQTISILPNTNYIFSTWIQSLSSSNPAQLKLAINGNEIGNPIIANSNLCTWSRAFITWNSGINTVAVLRIISNNNSSTGNDFALDDISFAPVYMKQDSIMVNVVSCNAVAASFTTPDTICVNKPVTITNVTSGASSYYWNFCVANINSTPLGANLGNINSQFVSPVFMDVVSDNGNYYGFVTNNFPGKLTRLDFGNSLLNTPTAINLGNVGGIVPDAAEAIQVIKNEGVWYAIIVGGNSTIAGGSRIVRINFGTNITNTSPTGTNWGNIGNLDYPTDLHVFNENGNWYGFTTNFNNNTVTRFNFGTSFNNTPSAINLGNVGGLNRPCGTHAVNNNGSWSVFVCNRDDNSLSRLDFGNSLLNTPTGTNLGNPSGVLNQPRDFYVLNFCGNLVGYLVNEGSNDLVRLNFGQNLQSIPTAISLGNVGNLSFPSSITKIFRVGADLYSFINNVSNNTLTRLKFTGCTNSSIPNSTLQSPPPITYNSVGTYNINLTTDDGLATQSSFCKQVVVVAPPSHSPTQNIAICNGDSITLSSNFLNATYVWSNGSTTSSIKVKTAGTYWVESTVTGGCLVRDSMIVTLKASPIVSAGSNVAICKSDSSQLNAAGATTYSWTPTTGLSNPNIANPKASPNTTTTYTVSGSNTVGCSATNTVTVTINPKPLITISANASICKDSVVQLSAIATGAILYSWAPATALNNPSISNPTASPISTTSYVVTITDLNNCKNKDSVLVTVNPKPSVQVRTDTSVCNKTPIVLTTTSSGATSFSWQPNTGLSNPLIANPIATPSTPTQYIVTASNGSCISKDTINLGILPLPNIVKSLDTIICRTGSASLYASGGVSYTWTPAYALSNTNTNTVIAMPDTTVWYYVTVTGSNACVNTDSIKVTVNPRPIFSVQPTNAIICKGDTLQISASGGDIYAWIPNTNMSSPNSSNTRVYPNITTLYKVGITNTACRVTDTLATLVSLNGTLATSVTSSNDIDCSHGQSTLHATGGVSYQWLPANGIVNLTSPNPVVAPIQTTTYYVKITDVKGCSNLDSVKVNVDFNSGASQFLMPSAFTPNGDGRNDCFGIKYWGSITEFDFNVYSRWGQLIFHTSNPTDCWDGTLKGQKQDAGTFIYQIKAKTTCGSVYRKGTVVLVR